MPDQLCLFEMPISTWVPPKLEFRRCEACGGMGFVRAGAWPEYSYPRCTSCGGIGQIYLQDQSQAAKGSS